MDWSLFLSKFSSANPNLDVADADDGLFLRGASDLHTINGRGEGAPGPALKRKEPPAPVGLSVVLASVYGGRLAISGIFLPDFPFAKRSGSAQKHAKSSP